MTRFIPPLLTLTVLATAACGGTAEGPAGPPASVQEALDDMELETQDRYLAVRQQQEQAMTATASVRQAPESASVEDLETALNTLNRALLRGRSEISLLRSAETQGRRPLMKELREANHAMYQEYQKLLAHRPSPTPEMLESGKEPAPEDAPES